VGCCTRDKLCDRCLEDTLAQLRGVAACRGENWANRVAARVSTRSAWPPFEDARCGRLARDKVADLTRDDRLATELARLVHQWAARRWRER